eukprot:Skav221699  [mRNA]  locus=scaffold1494:414050:420218:+ [translate_table: standard]
MGCCASVSQVPQEPDPCTPVNVEQAMLVDEDFHSVVHNRLRKLQELDFSTKVPFILIELTGEGPGEGEIEVTGKDEYRWPGFTVGEGEDGLNNLGKKTMEIIDAGQLWKGYPVVRLV